MGFVFRVAHVAITDLQHVGIIPVSRFGVGSVLVLRKADPGHGIPRVTDVAGGAPQIAANIGSPLPHVLAAILAKTVDNRAAGS